MRAAPVIGVGSVLNPLVEAGPRPIGGAWHVTVFDGILMDVVDMAFHVVLFLDGVLPVLRLPDSTATVAFSAFAQICFRASCGQPAMGELTFDHAQRFEYSVSP